MALCAREGAHDVVGQLCKHSLALFFRKRTHTDSRPGIKNKTEKAGRSAGVSPRMRLKTRGSSSRAKTITAMTAATVIIDSSSPSRNLDLAFSGYSTRAISSAPSDGGAGDGKLGILVLGIVVIPLT